MRFTLEFEFDESFDGRGLVLPMAQDVQRPVPAMDDVGADLQVHTPWQAFAENLAGTLEIASNPILEN